ncbi:MAG: TonB family protein [Casimicrobiaceae bacterium]
MDFARQQRDPTRHLVGITVVILVHALVIYALVTGLARKAVEVIKKPLTATIIEEIKLPPPPPPPPPKKVEIQPKIQPPPEQPYIPPPDIPLPVMPTEPVIAAPTITPPPEPHVIAPPPPAPPAPKPAIRRGLTPLFRVEPVYPREAIRAQVAKGRVVARLDVDEKGLVTAVHIIESEPPRVFDREVTRALSQWKFQGDGDRYIAEIEVNFTLKDN